MKDSVGQSRGSPERSNELWIYFTARVGRKKHIFIVWLLFCFRVLSCFGVLNSESVFLFSGLQTRARASPLTHSPLHHPNPAHKSTNSNQDILPTFFSIRGTPSCRSTHPWINLCFATVLVYIRIRAYDKLCRTPS